MSKQELFDTIVQTNEIIDDNNYKLVPIQELEKKELINFIINKKRTELENMNIEDLISEINRIYGEGSIKLAGVSSENQIVYPYSKFYQNYLFTGGGSYPTLACELINEIKTSNEIYMLVSFIKSSWNILYDSLKEFTDNGGKLKIITSTYMGISDFEAILKISEFQNTEILIEVSKNKSRHHAKVYGFFRQHGPDSIYIGSSNLSKPALDNGLEWNIKITSKTDSSILEQFKSKFKEYWNSGAFITFENDNPSFLEYIKFLLTSTTSKKFINDYNFNEEFELYSEQQKVIDQIQRQRLNNINTQLLIIPTGCGKTVIAASDYKNYHNKYHNLLFVAHRKELLVQAQKTFSRVLGKKKFGEIFDGNNKPDDLDVVFCNINSLSNLIEKLKSKKIDYKTYYDFIIIDEAHHVGSDILYNKLKEFNSKYLVGLTATPERSDQKSIVNFFNDTKPIQISFSDAINNQLICPFNYFVVYDNTEYNDKMTKKAIYKNLSSDSRKKIVLDTLKTKVFTEIRAICFCINKKHAIEMSSFFNENGYKSEVLIGESKTNTRNNVKERLSNPKNHDDYLDIICVVDLYNEGVDIPDVNTILLLRPTNSKIIFTQQLGRGLRKSPNKDVLTVFDFVGNSENDFISSIFLNSDTIYGKGNESVLNSIYDGKFKNLPQGCNIEISEKKRQDIIKKIEQKQSNIFNIEQFLLKKLTQKKSLTFTEIFKNFNINWKKFYSKNTITLLKSSVDKNIYIDQDIDKPYIKKFFQRIFAYDDLNVLFLLLEYFEDKLNSEQKELARTLIYIGKNNEEEKNHCNNIEYLKEEIIALLKYILELKNYCSYQLDKEIKIGCSYSRKYVSFLNGYKSIDRCGFKHPEKNEVFLFIDINSKNKIFTNYMKNNKIVWSKEKQENNLNKKVRNSEKIHIFVKNNKEDLNLFKYFGEVSQKIEYSDYFEFTI